MAKINEFPHFDEAIKGRTAAWVAEYAQEIGMPVGQLLKQEERLPDGSDNPIFLEFHKRFHGGRWDKDMSKRGQNG